MEKLLKNLQALHPNKVDLSFNPPMVVTIGGIDSLGAAGLTQDAKALIALGVHPLPLVSVQTLQDHHRLTQVKWTQPEEFLSALNFYGNFHLKQLKNNAPLVIKSGLLHSQQYKMIQRWIKRRGQRQKICWVVDPVLKKGSGQSFGSKSAQHISDFSRATIVTPNFNELAQLSSKGNLANEVQGLVPAIQEFSQWGIKAVYCKGGHAPWGTIGPNLIDFYWEFDHPDGPCWIEMPRLKKNIRGSGCFLASSLAAGLALGLPLADAVALARLQIQRAIASARPFFGQSIGATLPWPPTQRENFPHIRRLGQKFTSFPKLQQSKLKFYPLVKNLQQFQTCLRAQPSAIQLRIKDFEGRERVATIKEAISMAKRTSTLVFINDYLDLAIKYKANGLHLGQEDLRNWECLGALEKGQNLYLGVSTHSYWELGRALSTGPSYIALGPIFPTTLKTMPYPPQTPSMLWLWQKLLNGIPLVAIGGINLERLGHHPQITRYGVAVISDLLSTGDLYQRSLSYKNVLKCSAGLERPIFNGT